MAPTVVLLDLDGTLTDPLVGIGESICHALECLGLARPTDAELRLCIGPPLTESFARFGMTEEQLGEGIRFYRDRFGTVGLYENEVYPGIETALQQLRDAGMTMAGFWRRAADEPLLGAAAASSTPGGYSSCCLWCLSGGAGGK